jgi:hypothetical protein
MRIEQIRGLIAQATEALAGELEAGKSEQLQTYLAAIGRFHRYSVGNAILIWLQRPTATRVAGYHTWQQLGRQVRRSEKAISIMAPIVQRLPTEDENEDEERVVAFRPAQVFDVSQTDGKPLPEFETVKGDPGIYQQRLLDFLKVRGIVVEQRQLPASLEGVSAGGRIVVRQDLAPAEQFSVTVHEAAHELLHQGGKAREQDETVREVEAEAVAYIVSQAIGLDCSTAACDYIKLYDGKKETLLASLANVRRAANEIIEAILDRDEEVPREPVNPAESPSMASAA